MVDFAPFPINIEVLSDDAGGQKPGDVGVSVKNGSPGIPVKTEHRLKVSLIFSML
jgi:hypothetical protein